MISFSDFENTVSSQLGRDISYRSNPQQHLAIQAPLNDSLFIVAGPGSGKTTVIALRVLKLIFVDNIPPSDILVTTFTRKAATELRSRILGWGDQLRNILMQNSSFRSIRNQLQRLDFNQIITGTIDSIAEELLADFRAPGTPPPVVIEDFVSDALMMRVGLFSHGRHNNQYLRNYISQLKGSAYGLNIAEISKIVRAIKDRFYHDRINVNQFRNSLLHPGISALCDAIDDYNQELQRRLLFDFARLEFEFLSQLRNGTLNSFLSNLRLVLVDEYQDTNLLQEQIYFEFARAAIQNGGSITVVGDDDQSLYRFRGATVDLFQSFPNRISNQIGILPRTIYLSQNYRSTRTIVDFVNSYVAIDVQYQHARVENKPLMIPSRSQPYIDYPVLGMFRNDVNTLAHDLSQFIHQILHGGGFQIRHQRSEYLIRINPQGGSPADIAILCSSPRERDARGNPRLPLFLRNILSQLSPPIQVFNPRGQHLERIPTVQILCGLILECIDPHSRIQNSINRLPQTAITIFNQWRNAAIGFVNNNPIPRNPISLSQFVNAWQNRNPLRRRLQTREEVPLVDLVYKLITWIPEMQNDIEGLVYLEAITRTISDSALFSNFEAKIIFDPNNPNSTLEQASIREAIWNIFVPIALGAIEVNEDLLETLPSDRINIMSIHQAKGLEFPLVIIDVGSDFRSNHWKQAYKRFPRLNNNGRVDDVMSVNVEDDLRVYSQLGQPNRAAIDRAFDDLIRQFFVAYSRAQDVLLLVGLNSVRNSIPNIATGWNRNRNWHWGQGLHNLLHI